MSYENRKYQDDLILDIVKEHGKHRTVLCALPTGGGKTVVFSKLAHRFYHATGKNVLILVFREELMYQTQKTMKSIFDEDMPLIKAGTTWVKDAPAYIGMAESVFKRREYLDKFDFGLVIIDEAHNAMYNKLLRFFTKEYITGFTATPKSSSKKEPLNKYYGSIVIGPQIKELIALGNLSQNFTIEPKDVVERAKLAVDSTGEFAINTMADEYRKAKFVGNTLSAYIRFSLHKKTVIYNVNIEHSKDVCNLFQTAGFKCNHVDGTTPEHERREMFKWFKETPDAILCNVGVMTMGFDEPTIETIIVNRATTSMQLWLQMCGRGSRPIDEFFIQQNQENYPYQLKKKKRFNIIDMGGNRVSHADWCEDRDWQYIFDNPDWAGGGGIAPVKECPRCGCMVHAASIQCKIPMPTIEDPDAICGYIFDRFKYEENEVLEEFNFIDTSIDIEKLLRFNKNQANYFVFLEIGRKLIDETFNNNIELNDVKTRALFNRYCELIQMWHTRVFPEKDYNRTWHNTLAKKYFDKYLILKQNPVYENA